MQYVKKYMEEIDGSEQEKRELVQSYLKDGINYKEAFDIK